jgi:hypothetical protein
LAKAASEWTRHRWDQEAMSWPATTGPNLFQEDGSELADERLELVLELGGFPLTGQNPAGGGPQGHDGGEMLAGLTLGGPQGGASANRDAGG